MISIVVKNGSLLVVDAFDDDDKEDEILFQSPVYSDLEGFVKKERIVPKLVPGDKDKFSNLADVSGKKCLGYARLYFSSGWHYRWFSDFNGKTSLDGQEVSLSAEDRALLKNTVRYFEDHYPRGCSYCMQEDMEELMAAVSDNRYLLQPVFFENVAILVDTTYGNNDYPVRIYMYVDSDKKVADQMDRSLILSVKNQHGSITEWHYTTASEFLECVENHVVDRLTDDPVVKLSYSWMGVEMDEEHLREFGINDFYDLYNWCCSRDCDWFE